MKTKTKFTLAYLFAALCAAGSIIAALVGVYVCVPAFFLAMCAAFHYLVRLKKNLVWEADRARLRKRFLAGPRYK